MYQFSIFDEDSAEDRDIYSFEVSDEMLEDDELSSGEEGFMRGYNAL